MSEETMDWQAAKSHFEVVRGEYLAMQFAPANCECADCQFVLKVTFEPLAVRYNRGERSRQLFDEMMSVE